MSSLISECTRHFRDSGTGEREEELTAPPRRDNESTWKKKKKTGESGQRQKQEISR